MRELVSRLDSRNEWMIVAAAQKILELSQSLPEEPPLDDVTWLRWATDRELAVVDAIVARCASRRERGEPEWQPPLTPADTLPALPAAGDDFTLDNLPRAATANAPPPREDVVEAEVVAADVLAFPLRGRE
jgi:hypothetical protein